MPFRSLDPAKILATAERPERRVVDRFPDRGLAQVAGKWPFWPGPPAPKSRLCSRSFGGPTHRNTAAPATTTSPTSPQVIDMHQLTSDPVTLSPDFTPTEASPPRDLDAGAMSRYLVTARNCWRSPARLAALYSQAVPDEGLAQAVTDIELPGSSLSRKIWQKISLIDAAPPAHGRRAK